MAVFLQRQLNSVARVSTRDLEQLGVVANCVRFLLLTSKAPMQPETVDWILGSDERLFLLVDTLQASDNLKNCFKILDELAAHDPVGRDEYVELMLALAVVWDVPKRPPMHHQMGKQLLPYKPAITERYDYFKNLYANKKSKIEYNKLGVNELIFVVETPVPLSELEWVCANERGSLSGWGQKFSGIEYNHGRLSRSQHDWPHGPYELASIKQRGGICVDQAYYAVMTARAFGIPSIYFRAMGKGGGHAWFSFMKGAGDWVLDVGRYENENYTTGFAINPQTNQQMTDHDVTYACERSLHSADFAQAGAYVSIAEVLQKLDPDNARRCAREARQLVKRYLRPWEIELEILLAKKDYFALIDLFSEKKEAFRKYPDILTESTEQIVDALRAAGKTDEADSLMKSLVRGIDDDRDDLQRSFEQDRIEKIINSGDTKKARKELEQLMDDQVKEGSKVFPVISSYLKLTHKSGQDREAAKFMEDYMDELLKKNQFTPWYEKRALELLREAYINDRNKDKVSKLDTRIERLQYRQ